MTITASQTTVIKGDVNNNGIKDAGEIWVGDLDNDLAIDPGETVTTTVTISNRPGRMRRVSPSMRPSTG